MNKIYPKGSEWRKWDLQVQPIQNRWLSATEDITSELEKQIELSCSEFLRQAKEKSISVIGITDHNNGYAIDVCKRLSDDITVLPGVELDTKEGWHILVFFSEDYKARLKLKTWKEVVQHFMSNICLIDRPFYAAKDVSERIGITTLALLKKIKSEKIGIPILAHCLAGDGFFQRGNTGSRREILNAHQNGEVEFLFEIKDNSKHVEKIKETLEGWGHDFNLFGILSSSDAHSANDVGNCFSWIKADPNFEGLKQTLFEPKERLKIQEEQPEEKLEYQVIDKIQIQYSEIENIELNLNSGLNCIIGGRSTGKSILLSSIAKKLQSETIPKESNEGYNNLIKEIADSLSIVWKDGRISNDREIEFFHQGYMHQYSRNDKKFDDLIKTILKDKKNGNLFDDFESFCNQNKSSIQQSIDSIFIVKNNIVDKEKSISDLGDLEGINNQIEKFKKEITQVRETGEISESDYNEFQDNKSRVVLGKNRLNILQRDINLLGSLKTNNLVQNINADFLSAETRNEVQNEFENLVNKFHEVWKKKVAKIRERIDLKMDKNNNLVLSIEKLDSYKKGLQSLDNNNRLKTLEENLATEENKKERITALQNEIDELYIRYNNLKQSIINQHNQFHNKASEISLNLTTSHGQLEIKAFPKFLEEEYNELLSNSINLKSYERQDMAKYKHLDDEGFQVEVNSKLDKLLVEEITLKNSYTNQSLLQQIFAKSFYTVSYDINYDSDVYSQMSEGKQAFVVLMILLDFSEKKCPILIDQPEDDLDNRAIYNDLVTYLRKKKKERQILLVTHNPNIVVGTDSELIVVCNQHGVKNENTRGKKFQYFTGSIEHTFPKKEKEKVVLQRQGVREHICEILEGGENAFKLRERRYNLKS